MIIQITIPQFQGSANNGLINIDLCLVDQAEGFTAELTTKLRRT